MNPVRWFCPNSSLIVLHQNAADSQQLIISVKKKKKELGNLSIPEQVFVDTTLETLRSLSLSFLSPHFFLPWLGLYDDDHQNSIHPSCKLLWPWVRRQIYSNNNILMKPVFATFPWAESHTPRMLYVQPLNWLLQKQNPPDGFQTISVDICSECDQDTKFEPPPLTTL